MAQPTRDEAVALLEEQHLRVRTLLERLSPEERERAGTIGGGDWSAKDLLGHLALWEELAVEGMEAWRARRRPRAEDVFAGSIDAVNAEDVERKRRLAWDEVRVEADAIHDRLLALIREMDDDEWRAKALHQTERRTRLGSFLGSVLGAPAGPFRHADAHLPDLQAYVDSLAR